MSNRKQRDKNRATAKRLTIRIFSEDCARLGTGVLVLSTSGVERIPYTDFFRPVRTMGGA